MYMYFIIVSVNSIQWNPEECPDVLASCISSGDIVIIKLQSDDVKPQLLNRVNIEASACK